MYGLPVRLQAFCAARPPLSLVYSAGHGPVRSFPTAPPEAPYARIRSFCSSSIFSSIVFFRAARSASRAASYSVSVSSSFLSAA